MSISISTCLKSVTHFTKRPINRGSLSTAVLLPPPAFMPMQLAQRPMTLLTSKLLLLQIHIICAISESDMAIMTIVPSARFIFFVLRDMSTDIITMSMPAIEAVEDGIAELIDSLMLMDMDMDMLMVEE